MVHFSVLYFVLRTKLKVLSSRLSFDSKRRIKASWLQIYFFHVVHYRPLRPGREIVFESFNTTRRSLGKSLDRSVRAIAHVTDDLMFGRCALRKETIPNPLHVAAY